MPSIETEYPLTEQRSATFDAAGVAQIQGIGPSTPFERWEIDSTQCSSPSVLQSRLEIFDNSAMTRLVEGTYSGNLDNTNTVFKLRPAQKLYYRWSLGTPGALATVTLNGTRYVKGNRGTGIG